MCLWIIAGQICSDVCNNKKCGMLPGNCFFVKSFSIICGYLRSIAQLDVGLMKLLVEQLLVPHFENQSTVVRKQVVLSLAELRFVMEVRLLNQSNL